MDQPGRLQLLQAKRHTRNIKPCTMTYLQALQECTEALIDIMRDTKAMATLTEEEKTVLVRTYIRLRKCMKDEIQRINTIIAQN